MSLLEVTGLNTYYGDSHILFDVALRVERNEVVALLGRNGAGKSTTLKSLMGVVAPRNGSIMFDGTDIAGKKSHAVARAGMQLVHEDRRIFGSLNVEENLVLAGLTAGSRWPLERIYEMFPRLKERRGSRGTALSGGEQQMLAIARALIRDPKIILLDEPFEGLAPGDRARSRQSLPGSHRCRTDHHSCGAESRCRPDAGAARLHHQQRPYRARRPHQRDQGATASAAAISRRLDFIDFTYAIQCNGTLPPAVEGCRCRARLTAPSRFAHLLRKSAWGGLEWAQPGKIRL